LFGNEDCNSVLGTPKKSYKAVKTSEKDGFQLKEIGVYYYLKRKWTHTKKTNMNPCLWRKKWR